MASLRDVSPNAVPRRLQASGRQYSPLYNHLQKKQIASFISFSCDGLPDLSEHHQWTTSSGREGIDVMGELIASHLVEDDK